MKKGIVMHIRGWVFLVVGFSIAGVVWWVYSLREPSMVIIIPSYNNAEWYDKNLSSVFAQDYTDYKVIYIDDDSSDDTYARVIEKTRASGKQSKVTIIKNTQRKGALANIYHAVHEHCPDDAIVVLLDGDDWLKHDTVLSTVVKAYKDDNVWMTYGQDEMYPEGGHHHSRPLPQSVIDANAYRRYPWVTSHLRTFKAWLFKKIKKQDLMYGGTFFTVTWDMAILFPLLEMSAGRCKFIEDVLYVYNTATPLNDYKTKFELQQKCHYYIRNQSPYMALQKKGSS